MMVRYCRFMTDETIFKNVHQCIAYADDLIAMARNTRIRNQLE